MGSGPTDDKGYPDHGSKCPRTVLLSHLFVLLMVVGPQ